MGTALAVVAAGTCLSVGILVHSETGSALTVSLSPG